MVISQEDFAQAIGHVVTGFSFSFSLLISELEKNGSVNRDRLIDSFKTAADSLSATDPDSIDGTILNTVLATLTGDASQPGTAEDKNFPDGGI